MSRILISSSIHVNINQYSWSDRWQRIGTLMWILMSPTVGVMNINEFAPPVAHEYSWPGRRRLMNIRGLVTWFAARRRVVASLVPRFPRVSRGRSRRVPVRRAVVGRGPSARDDVVAAAVGAVAAAGDDGRAVGRQTSQSRSTNICRSQSQSTNIYKHPSIMESVDTRPSVRRAFGRQTWVRHLGSSASSASPGGVGPDDRERVDQLRQSHK